MSVNSKMNKQRVVVIGFDGATFDLINKWIHEGYLPNFQRIISVGVHGPLKTVIPPLTGPAWISFMTGKNPGKHGIYDFVIRSSENYYGKPISSINRSGESLWSIISRAGKKVGVFMVPATYPPEPVNGFMVTGMMTPADAQDFIYPPELGEDFIAAVPEMSEIAEGIMHPLGKEKRLLEGMERLTTIMMKSTDFFLKRYDLDFYMLVFKEPDLAMHWLWRYMDTNHPWYTSGDDDLRLGLRRVYERMDRCLAELMHKFGDDALLFVMSDHGSGSLETYFHVNTWLLKEGYIKLKVDIPTWAKRFLYSLGFTPINLYKLVMRIRQGGQVAKTMRHNKKGAIALLRQIFLSFDNVDWSNTQAYSLGNYGQIYINLKGREPCGIVSPGAEYEEIIEKLKSNLANLVDPVSKEPIRGHVYRANEIYHGEKLDHSADLIFLPDDLRINGFGLYQFPSNSWMEPTFDRSGGHRMDGIYIMHGPGARRGEKVSDSQIIDLAPTILASMGIPIPDDMDGKVLFDAFCEGYFEDRPITYEKAKKESRSGSKHFISEEDEELMRERLRGLGYMA